MVSGFAVAAEVGVSVLVRDRHHEQPIVEDPVADGVWETVGGKLALDDLVQVVAKNGGADVRPSRRPDRGCVDGVEETGFAIMRGPVRRIGSRISAISAGNEVPDATVRLCALDVPPALHQGIAI